MFAGNNLLEINDIKKVLDTTFSTKDLGSLKYFLGFEVSISTMGISLCQCKYNLDLLKETRLLGAKPASTPMDPSHNLHCEKPPPLSDPAPFRSLIGKLIYLSHPRHDISFFVCRRSQHLPAPIKLHLQATFEILRYTKKSSSIGVILQKQDMYNTHEIF